MGYSIFNKTKIYILDFFRILMFRVIQLHKLAAEGLAALFKQDKTNPRYTKELDDALKKFSFAWNSRGCRRYFESFGKLMAMAQTERTRKGETRENYECINYITLQEKGIIVNGIFSAKRFDYRTLLDGLSGVHTYSEIVDANEKAIDSILATA